MHKEITVFIVSLLIAVFAAGCRKEKVVPDKKPPAEEEGPVQYGDPFGNVPATADIVMYEVNFNAFSASGDLNGVAARLDEIKKLGVNVIWLMPTYPTGDERGIGSPYAIKNYTQVNPDLGDLDDLRALVSEAHERDMAVILDWVANHTAWDHHWIQNPSWYARDASGNTISPPGMGWSDVAELHYGSPAMRSEMIQAMKYWILEANVDGYRCDYAEGVPIDFWKQAIDSLRSISNRDIILFAEAADKELLSAGFDLIFGWDFYYRLKEVYNDEASAAVLTNANAMDYSDVPDGSHILRWVDNHDNNAWEGTPVNIFNGQDGAFAAFVVTAYMGGVPLIYNGQEVGYPNQLSFFENTNSKIDWSVNPEILTAYQELMAFRKESNAVKRGAIETYPSPDVVAFKRISGSEEVLVLVNVRHTAVDFELPDGLANTNWKNALDGQAASLDEVLSLAPYAYLVLTN